MYVKLKPAKKRWGLGDDFLFDDAFGPLPTSPAPENVNCMTDPRNPICGNPATANLPYGYEGAAVAMANLAASQFQPPTPPPGVYGPGKQGVALGGLSINPSYLLYGGVGLLGLMILMKAGRR